MNEFLPIDGLFSILTANISTTEIKQAILTSDIATTISDKRLELGMSKKQLAKLLGVSKKKVKKYEDGDYDFSISEICNIFDKLHIDCQFIFADKDDYNEENNPIMDSD